LGKNWVKVDALRAKKCVIIVIWQIIVLLEFNELTKKEVYYYFT